MVPLDLNARETALVQAEARFWQLGSLVSVMASHPASAPPPSSPRPSLAPQGAAAAAAAPPAALMRRGSEATILRVPSAPPSAAATPQTPRSAASASSSASSASAPRLPEFVSFLLRHPRAFPFPEDLAALAAPLGGEWVEAYRASRYGFAAREFYALCGGRGEAVAVYQDKNGYVFGGYTSRGWPAEGAHTDVADEAAFLFSLSNPHNLAPTVLPVKNAAYAVASDPIFGPSFGRGDVFAPHNSNVNQGSFDFPHDYFDSTGKGKLLFTGAALWTAKEIVVFVRPPPDPKM